MNLDTKLLKTITIMYVEDDPVVMNQTRSLFEKIFKKVFFADNGRDGLETYTTYKDEIEIIVTDINMPELNGIDMIKQINEINSDIPVIVTTAHTDSEHLLNAIELNVDKYIPKPVLVKNLTLNIVDLVSKYRKSKKIETLAKGLVQQKTLEEKNNQEMESELTIKRALVKYYETIIDNFVFSLSIDKTGEIKKASSKFMQFFEYDENEIIDKNINDLKCESCNTESFQQVMLKAIRTKKTIISTHNLIKKDGSKVMFDITMTPYHDNQGFVDGYTLYLDILL
ncbi:MAG: response regulator [Campylobacterota bacterium]|nr:response regulator [Campylobacterota bacterium]